jgi:hypothetical protein
MNSFLSGIYCTSFSNGLRHGENSNPLSINGAGLTLIWLYSDKNGYEK